VALRIEQDFKYKGEDYWKWAIWIDGAEDELDQVESVTYKLHPTFPKPVRTVTDRASKFRMATAGWGVFVIRAKVVTRDGEVHNLRHLLRLEYPDGTATTA